MLVFISNVQEEIYVNIFPKVVSLVCVCLNVPFEGMIPGVVDPVCGYLFGDYVPGVVNPMCYCLRECIIYSRYIIPLGCNPLKMECESEMKRTV